MLKPCDPVGMATPPDVSHGKDPPAALRAPLEPLSWAAAIVEHSDDAILSTRLDGIVVSWNASAERVFGYSASEMVGAPISRILPADRLHQDEEIIEQLISGISISPFDTQRIRKDGSTVHISATLSPIRDASGAMVGVSTAARDISSSKRLREQLEQANRDLTAIVDHCPGLISYWNSDYTNRYANKAYAETFGMRAQDIQGQHARDVLGPALYETSRSYIEAARLGDAQSFERPTALPNGDVRYHQLDYVPDMQSGDSRGLFVFVNDITARKLAEQALVASAARFEQLYEDTPAMMHSIDACGRLLSVSGYWLRKLGYALQGRLLNR